MRIESRRSSGFSLVELMVVVAIITVLMGMILPATQRMRETANRTVCTNNMRQIGIALHLYHDATARIPPSDSSVTWGERLCPFLEIKYLYRAGETFPIFVCPTRSSQSIVRVDYCAGAGVNEDGDVMDTAANAESFRDITDGMSNVVFLGEKGMMNGINYMNYQDGLVVIDYWGITGYMLFSSGISQSRYPVDDTAIWDKRVTGERRSQDLTPAQYFSDWAYGWPVTMFNGTGGNTTAVYYKPLSPLGFGAAHPDSMNILLCDGSVHRFRYGALGLEALLSRNDSAGTLAP